MHPKYQEVIDLRMKGYGYTIISKRVGISKNSVSRWCKDVKLPPSAQKIIEERIKYTKNKFAAYNRRRHRIVQTENRKIKESSAKQIHPLSKYNLLLVGAALHWGEGQKRGTEYLIKFSNSDPKMITLYLRFLREVLQIPEEKFYVSIRIHPNINAKSTIRFWSKVTNIPKKRFHITRQISRLSKGKRPKNSLPYGTLDLRVCDRRKFQQVKGWIDGLIQQT